MQQEFLTPPQAEREQRQELTPPDSDGGEDKPFQCGYPKCSYETNRRNNLKRHMMTMHERLNSPHFCCGVTFFRKADMRQHTKDMHTEGYPCSWPGCGKGFVRKALLDRHLKIHTGEKPFVCPVCQYGTSHKSNLDRHVRIHLKPSLSPGKFWPGQFEVCPPGLYPARPEEAPSLPDSTTDHVQDTPRRQSFLFSPDKLGFSMPFSPASLDLASITPLQLSPEKQGRRGRDDLEAWWTQAGGGALQPSASTSSMSPESNLLEQGPLTPPTPGKRSQGSISHGIAAILGSQEQELRRAQEEQEETIDVEGEEDEDGYIPKKMRLAKKH